MNIKRRLKIAANGTATLNLRFTGQFLKSYFFVFLNLDDLTVLNDDYHRSVFDGFDIIFDLCKSFIRHLFQFRHPYSFLPLHRKAKKDLGLPAKAFVLSLRFFRSTQVFTLLPDSFFGLSCIDLIIGTTNTGLTTRCTGHTIVHVFDCYCFHNQISFPLLFT